MRKVAIQDATLQECITISRIPVFTHMKLVFFQEWGKRSVNRTECTERGQIVYDKRCDFPDIIQSKYRNPAFVR